jgi:hypothetical protein
MVQQSGLLCSDLARQPVRRFPAARAGDGRTRVLDANECPRRLLSNAVLDRTKLCASPWLAECAGYRIPGMALRRPNVLAALCLPLGADQSRVALTAYVRTLVATLDYGIEREVLPSIQFLICAGRPAAGLPIAQKRHGGFPAGAKAGRPSNAVGAGEVLRGVSQRGAATSTAAARKEAAAENSRGDPERCSAAPLRPARSGVLAPVLAPQQTDPSAHLRFSRRTAGPQPSAAGGLRQQGAVAGLAQKDGPGCEAPEWPRRLRAAGGREAGRESKLGHEGKRLGIVSGRGVMFARKHRRRCGGSCEGVKCGSRPSS